MERGASRAWSIALVVFLLRIARHPRAPIAHDPA